MKQKQTQFTAQTEQRAVEQLHGLKIRYRISLILLIILFSLYMYWNRPAVDELPLWLQRLTGNELKQPAVEALIQRLLGHTPLQNESAAAAERSSVVPAQWDDQEVFHMTEAVRITAKKIAPYVYVLDVTNDGEANCQDAALLFYYLFPYRDKVKMMSNVALNHSFNAVLIKGVWVDIEPQYAGHGSPLMRAIWPTYNPDTNYESTSWYYSAIDALEERRFLKEER